MYFGPLRPPVSVLSDINNFGRKEKFKWYKYRNERGIMASDKEQMVQIIQELPEDSSYDEIIRELAFVRMIQRGLSDSEAKRLIGNEEIKQRIKSN